MCCVSDCGRNHSDVHTYPWNFLHLAMKVLWKSSLPRRCLRDTATATTTMMRSATTTTPMMMRGRLRRLRPPEPCCSIGLPRWEKNVTLSVSDSVTLAHSLSVSLSLSHTHTHTLNSCLPRVHSRDVKCAIASPARARCWCNTVETNKSKNRTNWFALWLWAQL